MGQKINPTGFRTGVNQAHKATWFANYSAYSEVLKEDYKITFSTEQGQRVLHDLERRCHAFATTFVKDNSHETAFLEGQRATLIFIKAMMQPHKE